MDMECLITLDDAVTALYAQLNAPSRRFAPLISSWLYIGMTDTQTENIMKQWIFDKLTARCRNCQGIMSAMAAYKL